MENRPPWFCRTQCRSSRVRDRDPGSHRVPSPAVLLFIQSTPSPLPSLPLLTFPLYFPPGHVYLLIPCPVFTPSFIWASTCVNWMSPSPTCKQIESAFKYARSTPTFLCMCSFHLDRKQQKMRSIFSCKSIFFYHLKGVALMDLMC